LAADLGQTGPESEARAAVAQLLRLSPGYTISERRRVTEITYSDATAPNKIADGLRKAGVPE